MKKEIIKINTKPKLQNVEIGDVVQFNSLEPVKVVSFINCDRCEYDNICTHDFKYCDFIEENNCLIMFEAI